MLGTVARSGTLSTNVEPLLREEREFVHTLGGYSVSLHGGVFVVHEKIPFPRFNFVQEITVRRDRAAGFIEVALDHYFSRAIRPTIRVATDAPEHIGGSLTRLGFHRRPASLTLLRAEPTGPPPAPTATVEVRPARPDELDQVVTFFARPEEQLELRRQIEVAWDRPGAEERLTPLLAVRDGQPIATALLHSFRGVTGIHGVATQTAARGAGVATAIVRRALTEELSPRGSTVWIATEHPTLERRLAPLGFSAAASFAVFDLPAGAELTLPPQGPPAAATWRPPRRPGGVE
jgi:GNAT superfamily N-acetyltransferase